VRSYAWRVAIVVIALLYPISAAIGKLVGWVSMAIADEPSDSYVRQVSGLADVTTWVLGIGAWFVAIMAAMEGMRADDKEARSLSRMALVVVVVAGLGFVGAYFFHRFMATDCLEAGVTGVC
jgi:hypothetical protein